MLTSTVAAIVVLGLLIFVHELGHFLAAKRVGVGVLRFSLGFGPVLVKKQVGETEYALSAIPLGGYVKMVGQEDDGSEPDRPKYFFDGFQFLVDHEGYPGIKPPWGELTCYDLSTGKKLWHVPLGEHEELTKQGMPVTGQQNLGGASVTAGGLVFVAGTSDEKLRAFDADTGKYKRHWGAYGNVPDDTAPRTPTYEGPSSQQFNTLNNSDSNGWAYMGVSPFTTVDLRNHWRIDARWSAAFGIDNLAGWAR